MQENIPDYRGISVEFTKGLLHFQFSCAFFLKRMQSWFEDPYISGKVVVTYTILMSCILPPPLTEHLLTLSCLSYQVKDLASVSLKQPVRIFVNSNTDVAPYLRQEFVRIRPAREGDREAIVAGELLPDIASVSVCLPAVC